VVEVETAPLTFPVLSGYRFCPLSHGLVCCSGAYRRDSSHFPSVTLAIRKPQYTMHFRTQASHGIG